MSKQDRSYDDVKVKADEPVAPEGEATVKDEEPTAHKVEKEENQAETEGDSRAEAEPQTVDLGEILVQIKNDMEREKAVSAEYLRRLQNLQADYDNFRKRTQREKEELAKYAAEKLVKDLLPVLDNLERALVASSKTQDFTSLAKGVEMIQRQINGVLAKEGLACIECVGQEFDPTQHEAVMHVEVEDYASNVVVDELQKGYFLKDKVLRPSMVKVNK